MNYYIYIKKEGIKLGKETSKSDFDENQVVEGFLNGGMLQYDAGVIEHLGTNEEIIRYGMLAPSSPEAQKLSYILYGIMNEKDLSQSESDYLDSIDSRFIGHIKKSDLSNREIVCLFLNTYWDWSKLEWTNDRTTSVVIKDLFKDYSNFCARNRFGIHNRRMKYDDFKLYLSKYGNVKRYRKNNRGKITNVLVISNLPAYKESLTKIPSFDLSKHTDLKQA